MFSSLTHKITTLFSRFGKQKNVSTQDIDALAQTLHETLLYADVPYELVQKFCAELKSKLVGVKIHEALSPQEQATKVMYDHLKSFLSTDKDGRDVATIKSFMMLGLQGAGKTTSIAKLAHHLKVAAEKKNKKASIVVASVDFYRPAAIDQLEILAQQINVDFYRAKQTTPLEAIGEIDTFARSKKYDHVIVDTAGRLHVDDAMVNEVKNIKSVFNPEYTFLVLDAMTGQESLSVAHAFLKSVGFDGAILTKMDSDTRGGAVFSFSYALKKPIVFLGTGEKPSDVQRFWPDRMANRLLGYGDMTTLAEKAEEKIKQTEQESIYHSLSKGNFTLQDFADQMGMMSRLGSMGQLMKYMPGMAGANISQDDLDKGERELAKFKAIISSMTFIERYNPEVLNGSRKKRVARGAGVRIEDINLLLSRFEQSKQYVKLLKKAGLFQRFFK